MSETAMRDLVARLATEPTLGEQLDTDPDSFARHHDLTGDEIATLRSLTRGAGGSGPVRLRERLSRSGMAFGGALGDLADMGPAPDSSDGSDGGSGSVERPARAVPADPSRSERPGVGRAVPAGPVESPRPVHQDPGLPRPVPAHSRPVSVGEPARPVPVGQHLPRPVPAAPPPAPADSNGDVRIAGTSLDRRPVEYAPALPPDGDGSLLDGEARNDAADKNLSSIDADRRRPPGTPLEIPETPPAPVGHGRWDAVNRREIFDLGADGELSRYGLGGHSWGDTVLRKPDGVEIWWRAGSVSRVDLPDGSGHHELDDGSGRRVAYSREPDGASRQAVSSPDGRPPVVRYTGRDGVQIDADLRAQRTGLLAELPEAPDEEPTETYVDRQSQSVSRVYANGTTVTSYRSGIVFTELSDGSTVQSRIDGGSTTRRPNADGSWHFVDREPGPPPTVTETTRWLDRLGADAAPRAGLASLPPQPTGVPDSVTRGPDGSIVRSYPDVTVTSRPDGSVVADYGPAGTVEHRADNGRVVHTRVAGDVLVVSPDGSAQHATPRGDGTFLVVPRNPDGTSGEPYLGRRDGRGGFERVGRPTEVGGRRTGTGATGGGSGRGGFQGSGPGGGGSLGGGPGGGGADHGLPVPPPDATVEELPGGGQLIRYADGSTATVLPNGDGTFHVVTRDAAGVIVAEYDTGGVPPPPAPADDVPLSLLGVGAAAAGVGAAAAAAARRRRRAARADDEV